ncbi:hypothetical protein GWI33_014952 [Rhynchophorus ferrugineus]|uniref:Uncharacterized protein n=1 Tax=Rhynchophorus ferrugineus TaxID=354439 RepID=A0A834I0M4_RHYFE|nr:hypothetical protein GWI33_014952 [Rhynchophorus ferrugineus]
MLKLPKSYHFTCHVTDGDGYDWTGSDTRHFHPRSESRKSVKKSRPSSPASGSIRLILSETERVNRRLRTVGEDEKGEIRKFIMLFCGFLPYLQRGLSTFY